MTSTAVATLPTTSDPSQWSGEEKALVEAAGLVHVDARSGERTAAPRPVVAAFLGHCARTGLDPIARQIYCLARKSKGQLKWQIQVSIDGARLVAERSGQYEGQTPVEWTADGVTWTQVWLSPEHPAAARVGVFRRGFREALFAVATWDSYAVYDDVWENGHKTGDTKVSAMWGKMGPLMLGKCAEMLALRKAFPQDLSGLYSTEEMAQANPPAPFEPSQPYVAESVEAPAAAPVPEPVPEPSRDWVALASACRDREDLRAVYRAAEAAQELGFKVEDGSLTVKDVLWRLRGQLPEPEDVVDAEVVEDAPTEVTEWPTVEPGSGGPTEDPGGVQFK